MMADAAAEEAALERPTAAAVSERVANGQESVEELESVSGDGSFEARLRTAIDQRRSAARQKRRHQLQGHLFKIGHSQDEPQPTSQPPTKTPQRDAARPQETKEPAPTAATDLAVSVSHPVYSRVRLAPTTSAPASGRDGPAASTRNRQRRGSRFEKTSLKLNRLFESSLSMLPQADLTRTTRHSTTSGRRNPKHRQERGNTSTIQPNYATRAANVVACYQQQRQQEMVKGEFYPVKLLDHHQSRRAEKAKKPQEETPRKSTSGKRIVEGYLSEDDEDKDVDGGYAWIILAVMFVINASTFGTARAYGLIFDKLARVDEHTRAEAALPFTIMGAIENMAGPLSGCLLARTSSWRLTVFAGSCLVTLAHLLAAMTAGSQLGQLLSMGLMCGLGLSFVSISFFQVNNAYFVRYRNTAFGISMTGAVFGTLYISSLCQYFLDNYEGTGMCYLILGLIVAPNVPMSLLLKPKRAENQSLSRNESFDSNQSGDSSLDDHGEQTTNLKTISERIERGPAGSKPSILTSIKLVILNPLFHLIWPTQLLFCWFNFVFGMIIVDFGKDRGLSTQDVSHLIPIWAFGQLIGRLVLSTLVDLKLLSYRSFTIICFAAISITTHFLNNTRLNDKAPSSSDATPVNSLFCFPSAATRQHLIFLMLVLVLSMFIALLYILLNGLVVNYVEKSLQPLSIGISSFTGSFFLLPRAYVIGYYRDIIGNYDAMLTMFTFVSLCAALTWLIIPTACKYLVKFYDNIRRSSQMSRQKKNHVISIMTPYSTWRLATGGKAHQVNRKI